MDSDKRATVRSHSRGTHQEAVILFGTRLFGIDVTVAGSWVAKRYGMPVPPSLPAHASLPVIFTSWLGIVFLSPFFPFKKFHMTRHKHGILKSYRRLSIRAVAGRSSQGRGTPKLQT